MSSLSDGGFIVTWTGYSQDGSSHGVYAQQYDVNGDTVGGEFRVNSTTTNSQDNPDVAGLNGGGYVVVWESTGQDDGLGTGSGASEGVYAQLYDADGNTVGGEFHVSGSQTSGDQDDARVVALNDGGFVITWESAGQDGSGEGAFASAMTRGPGRKSSSIIDRG